MKHNYFYLNIMFLIFPITIMKIILYTNMILMIIQQQLVRHNYTKDQMDNQVQLHIINLQFLHQTIS